MNTRWLVTEPLPAPATETPQRTALIDYSAWWILGRRPGERPMTSHDSWRCNVQPAVTPAPDAHRGAVRHFNCRHRPVRRGSRPGDGDRQPDGARRCGPGGGSGYAAAGSRVHHHAGEPRGRSRDRGSQRPVHHLTGARDYGVATKYYGVTHTSEPNYIAATSGSTWWTNDDDGWYTGNHYPDPKIAGNHYPHTNIVTEMEARHIPWDAYMQAMPSSGYLPDSWPATSPLYVSKHNPFILYNDVRSDPQWRDHIRPYQNMTADLNGPNPPRYVWISPDLCSDMHGGVTAKIKGFPETPCPYSNVAGDHNDELLKAKADAFVKQAVHTITTSRAWTGNSVIFVTADESDYDGSDAADNYYLSTAGCCDSPYLPAGDPEISPKWPGASTVAAPLP